MNDTNSKIVAFQAQKSMILRSLNTALTNLKHPLYTHEDIAKEIRDATEVLARMKSEPTIEWIREKCEIRNDQMIRADGGPYIEWKEPPVEPKEPGSELEQLAKLAHNIIHPRIHWSGAAEDTKEQSRRIVQALLMDIGLQTSEEPREPDPDADWDSHWEEPDPEEMEVP